MHEYEVIWDDWSQEGRTKFAHKERALGLAKQIASYRHADGRPQYASVSVWVLYADGCSCDRIFHIDHA